MNEALPQCREVHSMLVSPGYLAGVQVFIEARILAKSSAFEDCVSRLGDSERSHRVGNGNTGISRTCRIPPWSTGGILLTRLCNLDCVQLHENSGLRTQDSHRFQSPRSRSAGQQASFELKELPFGVWRGKKGNFCVRFRYDVCCFHETWFCETLSNSMAKSSVPWRMLQKQQLDFQSYLSLGGMDRPRLDLYPTGHCIDFDKLRHEEYLRGLSFSVSSNPSAKRLRVNVPSTSARSSSPSSAPPLPSSKVQPLEMSLELSRLEALPSSGR